MHSRKLRDLCVRELHETEVNYVRSLRLIVEKFANPLENWLSPEDHQCVFSQIKYFLRTHESFKGELERACLTSSLVQIITHNDHRHTPSSSSSSITNNESQQNNNQNNEPQGGKENSPEIKISLAVTSGDQEERDQRAQSSDLNIIESESKECELEQNSRLVCAQVALCFLKFKGKFLKYDLYCSSLSKINLLLESLVNRDPLLAFELQQLQQEANGNKFSLRDLLALPFQRILKYHILLGELLKNWDHNHAQSMEEQNNFDGHVRNPTINQEQPYETLKLAFECMVDIGQYINEMKRDTESMQQINELQASISELIMPQNTQLTDYGRLIHEGPLKVPNCEREGKYLKKYVFLFDKVLLICKQLNYNQHSKYKYQFQAALVLSNFQLTELLQTTTADSNEQSNQPHYKNDNQRATANKQSGDNINQDSSMASPLLILGTKFTSKSIQLASNQNQAATDSSSRNSCCWFELRSRSLELPMFKYRFVGKTPECRQKWVEAIALAMNNIEPIEYASNSHHRLGHPRHQFIMHTFERATSCDHCGKLLLGLFYQGYRCRICFVSSHKTCLPYIRGCGFVHLKQGEASAGLLGHHIFLTANTNNLAASTSRSLHQNPTQRPRSAIPLNSLTTTNNNSNDANNSIRPKSPGNRSNLSDDVEELSLLGHTIQHSLSSPCFDSNALFFDNTKNTLHNSDQTGKPAIVKSIRLIDNDNVKLIIRKQPSHADNDQNRLDDIKTNFPDRHLHIKHHLNDVDFLSSNQTAGYCQSKVTTSRQERDTHLNFLLREYPWFWGLLDRVAAHSLLCEASHGTFLVRISAKLQGSYVISLNYQAQIQHMRVFVADNQLYLIRSRMFRSIIELIGYYQNNSLSECFSNLDTKLEKPLSKEETSMSSNESSTNSNSAVIAGIRALTSSPSASQPDGE